MHITQVIFTIIALICSVSSKGYGPGVGSYGTGGLGSLGSGIAGGPGSISNIPGSISGRPGGIAGGPGGAIGRPGGIGGLPGALSGRPGSVAVRPGGFPAGAGGIVGGPGGNIGLTGGIAGRPGGISGRPGGIMGYPTAGVGSSIYGYDMSPKPFVFDYTSPDGQGGLSSRSESGDGSGAVTGSYAYTDAQGLYRMVEYVADQDGFRATVMTNEPGVDGKENPADINMLVQEPPAGLQEMYTPASAYGAGGIGLGGLQGAGVAGGYPVGPGSRLPGGAPGVYGGMTGVRPGGAPGVYGGMAGVRPGGVIPGASVGGLPGAGVRYPGGVSGLPGMIPGSGAGLPGGFMRPVSQGGISGGLGPIGGGSGLFTGIPLSSSGKSVH